MNGLQSPYTYTDSLGESLYFTWSSMGRVPIEKFLDSGYYMGVPAQSGLKN